MDADFFGQQAEGITRQMLKINKNPIVILILYFSTNIDPFEEEKLDPIVFPILMAIRGDIGVKGVVKI